MKRLGAGCKIQTRKFGIKRFVALVKLQPKEDYKVEVSRVGPLYGLPNM